MEHLKFGRHGVHIFPLLALSNVYYSRSSRSLGSSAGTLPWSFTVPLSWPLRISPDKPTYLINHLGTKGQHRQTKALKSNFEGGPPQTHGCQSFPFILVYLFQTFNITYVSLCHNLSLLHTITTLNHPHHTPAILTTLLTIACAQAQMPPITLLVPWAFLIHRRW